MIGYYNRQGEPITLDELGRLLQDPEYKVVMQSDVSDSTRISTVWLGIDHGFRSDEPHIFETMVFSDRDDVDGLQWRYPNEGVAIVGHWEMVALVAQALGRAS